MGSDQDKETLSMVFEGEWLRKLKWVMEERGIHNKTEAVRVLIKEDYDRKTVAVQLPPDIVRLVDDKIKEMGVAMSRDEFIEKAVEKHLHEKRKP